jgi:hypothetical protein
LGSDEALAAEELEVAAATGSPGIVGSPRF